jgi:hypothetical protein
VPFVLIHHVRKQGADDFQHLVSGTNGRAGAADAIMVLERARRTGWCTSPAARSRSFDARTGVWTKLDGPAGDYQMHKTRVSRARLVVVSQENAG